MTWQTIDTAPRDGTEILLWRKGWYCAPVAKWVTDGDADGWLLEESLLFGVAEGFLGWQEDIDDGCMPTHWAPMPEVA